MPESNEANIEIRSDEVQEILSHIPNWLIRWGITVIFFTVLTLILASWFIKYPDKISARVTITTMNPPTKIIARSTGNIELLVKDKAWVEKNELLGIIENPAKTEDILYLKGIIRDLGAPPYKRERLINLKFRDDLELGNLQNSYLTFQKALLEYQLFINLDFFNKRIDALENSILQHQQRSKKLKEQLFYLKQETSLEERQYKNDSLLYEQGAATKIQMNNSKAALLRSQRSIESAETAVIDNDIQITNLKRDITDTKLQKKENEDQLKNAFDETFNQLKSQFAAWEQQYFLIAPIAGNVTTSKYWSDNQYVNTGEEVMTIIPKSGDMFGQMLTPIAGSGKIEIGQRVNIKFDNYPSNEYGMVTGKVESISSVPRDNQYTIRISLPNGLTSSYKKQLDFKQEMQGNADIITRELRLIERVFNQVRSLADNAS